MYIYIWFKNLLMISTPPKTSLIGITGARLLSLSGLFFAFINCLKLIFQHCTIFSFLTFLVPAQE